ncbi:hypothetical protein FNV43_RR16598 [Rhamnella rubrinervis]|uniref:SUN domain-containing protein n=1 Tax=Rhamnella rubrinervis TaxID=2594499 RepID=A0A8K0GZ26_9ROSA|nr:hypothetical protein FNV43_RR16598 [Rhamnella rubrinervis]
MSASTVSITANPATRRRPVVASEKKSNIELVPAEPQTRTAADKTAPSNGRDLSNHSIRGGEAILERTSRDAVQLKRSVPSSTVSPPNSRRSRKAIPARPRWLTILSVFTKNFILLLTLVGLVQMVRRLALRSADDAPMAFTDFEGRIAGLETLLKTTTKMIQVQVEVVDRKVDSEVGGLKREVKKIDDNGLVVERKLKELEVRSDELERLMDELRTDTANWLSKEEFNKIYEDFKKSRSGEYGDEEASLNDIRVYARDVVRKEIEKHAADGLGRVDYALSPGGAMVVKHSEPYLAGKASNWFLMNAKKGVHNNADKMLKPSFGEPGQCFPLKGTSGFVQIRLRTAIIPEAVTLEHVAKSVAYDRSSAPKSCRVSGWLQERDIELPDDTEKMYLLAEFTYDLEKSNAQTFHVLDSASSSVVNTVRFDFSSNHGSPSHTCIYRLRVHGHEPDSVSMMAMQS